MEMSLAANLSAVQHNHIRQEAQYRVMGMVKEKLEDEGSAIMRLIEKQEEIIKEIEPHRGQKLNIYA